MIKKHNHSFFIPKGRYLIKKSSFFSTNIVQEKKNSFLVTTTKRDVEKLIPFYEQRKYNIFLHQTTIFPYEHTHRKSTMERRVLSFRFRPIEFNKKRSLLFFLSLELLTSKKAVAVLSSQNIQSWKIRKGRLVACKVTLRKENLFQLRDSFTLSFSRREKLSAFPIKNGKKRNNRIAFGQRPTEFRFGELVLFYPLELTRGLHPDLQYLHRSITFDTLSLEERAFLLRSLHFPFLFFFFIEVPVAQLDRVSDYGSDGWKFESFRACIFYSIQ